MASSSSSSLCILLEQIKTQLQHDCNFHTVEKDSWKNLFIYTFVQNELSTEQDDLLFFVHKQMHNNARTTNKPRLDVMRKCSPNLPLSHTSINWKDTLLLNLIIQRLEYELLFSICTRTSPKHVQVLSKQRLTLYATPSAHSVHCKESSEQYSYPIINFYIDNYEEYLFQNVVNDFELIYIELVVKGLGNELEPFVIFSSAVGYQTLSVANDTENRISFNGQYIGLIQINNNDTQGTAEIVVKKKIKRSISDGATFTSAIDLEEKPNMALSINLGLLNIGVQQPQAYNCTVRSQKHHHHHHSHQNLHTNSKSLLIESNDTFDDIESHLLANLWIHKGFPQTYFEWKEQQKRRSNSFHSFVTNISLPCSHIIDQLLSFDKKSSLLIS